MRRRAKRLVVLVSFMACAAAAAGPVGLSFTGAVDASGATLGGVNAPLGSRFTLDIVIDDSAAASGRYAIDAISYTLTLGTYTTVTNWHGITELVATPSGSSITLASDPLFASPDEHFLLNLSGFGQASSRDPSTWGGPAALTGDIIVRGLGGFGSPDQLSGLAPYSGTMTLEVETCYPDCTGDTTLDIFDFLCFQDAFVAMDAYADCTANGVFDIFDFLCYQDSFVAGCP